MQVCKQTTLTRLEPPLSGGEKPDFALYCTREESVSNSGQSVNFLPLESRFSIAKIHLLSLYVTIFNLVKPKKYYRQALRLLSFRQIQLFPQNFPLVSVILSQERWAMEADRQAAPRQKNPPWHFCLRSNLIIICKLDSTELALWGVLLQPPFLQRLKNNRIRV